MQIQIDLGNLAVGVGTAAVALVTLWVARNNFLLTRKQKIADYRIQWMSELRNTFTSLYKAQYELAHIKRDIRTEKNKTAKKKLLEKREKLYFESASYKVHILTMIKQHSNNPHEKELDHLLRKAVSGDLRIAQEHRKEMRELTRSVLHKEWKRIVTEIEGN